MSATLDLTLYQMRDNTIDVSLMTAVLNPVDLTGYKLICTVKALITDADSAALYQGEPKTFNPPFGRFSFLIPIATTNGWTATQGIWDVTCVTPTNLHSTLIGGNVTIVPAVTQTFTAKQSIEAPAELAAV